MYLYNAVATAYQTAVDEAVVTYWQVKVDRHHALFMMFLAYIVHLLIEGALWFCLFLFLGIF